MPIFNIYLSSNMDDPTIVQSEGKDRVEAITSYIRHYIDSNEAGTPLRGIEFCFQADDPVCEQIVFEPTDDDFTAHWRIDTFHTSADSTLYEIDTESGVTACISAPTPEIALYIYSRYLLTHGYTFGASTGIRPFEQVKD